MKRLYNFGMIVCILTGLVVTAMLVSANSQKEILYFELSTAKKTLVSSTKVLVELEEELEEKEKELSNYRYRAPFLLALKPLFEHLSEERIHELIDLIPKGNPFKSDFQVTASFGESTGLVPRTNHRGIDIIPKFPERMNWTVFAFAPGEVVSYGLDKIHGKNVIVEHFPWLRTKYSHLSKIYYTAVTGCKVDCNTRIGEMGNTGYADGAHLHFEIQIKVRPDLWIRIDPRPFLIFRGE